MNPDSQIPGRDLQDFSRTGEEVPVWILKSSSRWALSVNGLRVTQMHKIHGEISHTERRGKLRVGLAAVIGHPPTEKTSSGRDWHFTGTCLCGSDCADGIAGRSGIAGAGRAATIRSARATGRELSHRLRQPRRLRIDLPDDRGQIECVNGGYGEGGANAVNRENARRRIVSAATLGSGPRSAW